MKVKRSTGIKRITITLTFVLPIFGFILNAALGSDALGVLGLICIPLPAIVYKVGYWIADGFQRDKE